MTAVWTAMSLQRRDGSSNSLSRSLGSLMSPGNVDDYSTVMLHSNMVASSSASHSRWSVGDHLGEGTDLDTAQSRQVQTPLPKLQRILTDSASSIMFLGKRILREYQSVFVLPDKQQVFVRRNEVFMPEDAVSEVTLSMAVSAPPEVRSFSAENQVRRRVQEFLENDDWKSAMLASSESRDAELLGYMNSRYSNSATRRSRLERSESRRRRQEIVKARELYSDDEEGEVQFSSDEELAEKPLIDPSLERRIISPPRTISPEPLLPDRVGRSAPSLPQRAPHFRAPIIARSDTPGKRNVLESNEQTKKKFEEIRRRWDERIATEQFHSQEQFEGAGGQSVSSTSLYNEGHRGTAITSILPKTDRREKYAESAHTQNTRTLPPISPQSDHDLRSGPHYFLNRTNTLPDTHTKSGLPGLTRYGERQMVPSPTYSEPFTEREEKETRFSYSQTRLKVGQENFGQLGHNLESHSPTRLNKTYAALRTQSLDRSVESRVIYEAMHTIESIPFRLSATSRPRYSARLQSDSHQASMSLNVDQKPRLYMDSKFKQNYIYRTTLSRLPITVRHFRARRHSAIETTESELTEGDRSIKLAERNFTLSRQPTLLIDWQSVKQKSRTLPPRLTTKATVCLKAPTISSETTSRKRYVRSESNQERLTIHITDQQETIVHGDFLAQSISLRRRPASAEPRPTFEPPHVLSPTRARNALLVYPQPSGTFNWKSCLTGSVSPSLICTDQQEPQPGYKSDLGLPSVTTDEDFDSVSPTYPRLHRIDHDHDPYMPILSHRTHPSVPIPPTDHRTAQETAKDLWYRGRHGRVPFVDHKESFVRRPARARSSPSYATDQYPDEETHYTSMGETRSVSKRPISKPVEPTKPDNRKPDYSEDESSKQYERFSGWEEIRPEGKEEATSSTDKLLHGTHLKFFDEDRGYKPKYEDSTFNRYQFFKGSPLKPIGQVSYFFPHDSEDPGESHIRTYSKSATDETNSIDYFLAPTPYRVKEWGSKQWVSVPSGARSTPEDKPTVPPKLPLHHPPTGSSVAIKRSASVQDSRYRDSVQPKGRRILRRKSDLDQNLEDQFDKVYREELSRRESEKIDRAHPVDQCSSSDLSVLASREEDEKELRTVGGKRRTHSASRSIAPGGIKVDQPQGNKTYPSSLPTSGDKKPILPEKQPTPKTGLKHFGKTHPNNLSPGYATTSTERGKQKTYTTSMEMDATRYNDRKTDPHDQRRKSGEAVRPSGVSDDEQWDLEHRTGKADRPHQLPSGGDATHRAEPTDTKYRVRPSAADSKDKWRTPSPGDHLQHDERESKHPYRDGVVDKETVRRQSRTGDGVKSAEGALKERPGGRDPHDQRRKSGEAVRPSGVSDDEQWDLEHRTGKADRPHQLPSGGDATHRAEPTDTKYRVRPSAADSKDKWRTPSPGDHLQHDERESKHPYRDGVVDKETVRRQSRTGDGVKSAEGALKERPGGRDPHDQRRKSGEAVRPSGVSDDEQWDLEHRTGKADRPHQLPSGGDATHRAEPTDTKYRVRPSAADSKDKWRTPSPGDHLQHDERESKHPYRDGVVDKETVRRQSRTGDGVKSAEGALKERPGGRDPHDQRRKSGEAVRPSGVSDDEQWDLEHRTGKADRPHQLPSGGDATHRAEPTDTKYRVRPSAADSKDKWRTPSPGDHLQHDERESKHPYRDGVVDKETVRRQSRTGDGVKSAEGALKERPGGRDPHDQRRKSGEAVRPSGVSDDEQWDLEHRTGKADRPHQLPSGGDATHRAEPTDTKYRVRPSAADSKDKWRTPSPGDHLQHDERESKHPYRDGVVDKETVRRQSRTGDGVKSAEGALKERPGGRDPHDQRRKSGEAVRPSGVSDDEQWDLEHRTGKADRPHQLPSGGDATHRAEPTDTKYRVRPSAADSKDKWRTPSPGDHLQHDERESKHPYRDGVVDKETVRRQSRTGDGVKSAEGALKERPGGRDPHDQRRKSGEAVRPSGVSDDEQWDLEHRTGKADRPHQLPSGGDATHRAEPTDTKYRVRPSAADSKDKWRTPSPGDHLQHDERESKHPYRDGVVDKETVRRQSRTGDGVKSAEGALKERPGGRDPHDQRRKSGEAVRPSGVSDDEQWDLEHRTGKADRPHQLPSGGDATHRAEPTDTKYRVRPSAADSKDKWRTPSPGDHLQHDERESKHPYRDGVVDKETVRRQSRTGDGVKSAEGALKERPGGRDPHDQRRKSGEAGIHDNRFAKSDKRHKELSETERTESFRKDSRGSVVLPNEPISAPGHSDSGDRIRLSTTTITDPSVPPDVGDVRKKRGSDQSRLEQELDPRTSKTEEPTGKISKKLQHPVGPHPVQPQSAEDIKPYDVSDPTSRHVDRTGGKRIDENSLRKNALEKTKYPQDTDVATSKQVKQLPYPVQQPSKTHVKPMDSKREHEPDKGRGASKRFSHSDVRSPHRESKPGDIGDEPTKWPVAHHKSYDPLAPINVTRGKTNEQQAIHDGDSERTSYKKDARKLARF
ncbi:hypothetical protein AHF37_02538 [Paragonimus kellicotti]|nr:hypothetical protein AHF37_02538 [Paragonimus kellicotti]